MKLALFAFGAALSASAAWAGDVGYNAAYAPQGTHLQSGTPDCQLNGSVVECSSYELAGVGNTNAQAFLSATYSGTVLCKNPAGHVAPGQTEYPTIMTKTDTISPKNGRMTVPALSSTTNTTEIENSLKQHTSCPRDGKWTKSVQEGSITLVGYTYTLKFTGYGGAYITITG